MIPSSALTQPQRLEILDAVELMLDQLYAHLPLKRARYGIDPLQRLRILRSDEQARDDEAFHIELAAILTSLRDYHTRYVWHRDGIGRIAMLPFMVEMYGRDGAPRYMVSKVGKELAGLAPDFVPGVLLHHWNGVPIDRAVLRHAGEECAGRPDGLRAASLQSLTLRPLQFGPPPDEAWVIVGYHATDAAGEPTGPLKEARVHWRTVDLQTAERLRQPSTVAGSGVGDPHQRAVNASAAAARQARMGLFAPQALRGRVPGAGQPVPLGERGDLMVTDIRTSLPDILRVQRLQAGKRPPVGYLRIWGFDVEPVVLIAELLLLIPELPQDALIIDIRGNPGGNIAAAEQALQLFTPNRVAPTRFSLRATPRSTEFAQHPGNAIGEALSPWKDSLEAALRNGEPYTRSLPLTDMRASHVLGQQYGGRLLLVADTNTYSAGDLFTAGFVDNRMGPFICVGQATGGGGANVWSYSELRDELARTRAVLPRLPRLPRLPPGVGLSFAFRRAMRSGPGEGLIIEDLGIPCDSDYPMTREDLLDGNRHLLLHCIQQFDPMQASRLELRATRPGDALLIETLGLDRVDLLVDEHPYGSFEVDIGGRITEVPLPATAQGVEARGYRGQVLLQRRRAGIEAGL